ncbi:MAG: creatininase family protein [Candidatus Bathyarchaeia archaeon]|jgi:creatinine amidohydrolase
MRIDELTSRKASQLIGKIDTIIIPVGTIEAHGPHCSLMSDVLITQKLADEVDQLAGDRVFVGPAIPYGHTWELQDQPGSHLVSKRVLAEYVLEVIKGFQKWKIKYVILLNGHGSVGFGTGGNIEPLHEAAERATELGMKTLVLLWCFAPEAIKKITKDVDGHAGEAETSVVWFLGDKYVDKDAIPKAEHRLYSTQTQAQFSDIFDPELNRAVWPMAYWGKPSDASPEKGRLIHELLAKSLVEIIDAMRAGTLIKPYK